MRAIIDTNIFIYSESSEEIQENVAKLISLAIKHGLKLLVHPASTDDLQRDSDRSRRKIHVSKLGKYPILEDDVEPDDSFLELIGFGSRPQDEVDNRILFSIYKNAANFFITEDLGLHRKAQKIGVGDRVLTISQTVTYLERQFERSIPSHILLEHLPIHKLNLQSEFFNSLREVYDGFDDWFIKKSQEGRMCWC